MKETKLLGTLMPSHPDLIPIIQAFREKYNLPEISLDDNLIQKIYLEDKTDVKRPNFDTVMQLLNLTESDITLVQNIKKNVFDSQLSVANKIFAKARGLLKKHKH